MFTPAIVLDLNGSLDWAVPATERYATAGEAWLRPETAGAVLRWEGAAAAELIVDAHCARCPDPADGFLIGTAVAPDAPAVQMCDMCALTVPAAKMLRWVTMSEAAAELGLAIRAEDAELAAARRRERDLRAAFDEAEATVLGAELAAQVIDAGWRAEVAAATADNPRIAAQLAAAVAALDDLRVLDLYPALTALGRALPGAAVRTLRAAEVGRCAAARLGLPATL